MRDEKRENVGADLEFEIGRQDKKEGWGRDDRWKKKNVLSKATWH